MAKVHVSNVMVLDNPATFLTPFQFEITFECIEELKEDLEWKIIYVGSAESEAYDQVLDTVFVGPVPEGRHMFVFQADPPDTSKIPLADAVGVTVVLLTCSYRGKEFVRVGYYVNNEYSDPDMRENPPTTPQYDKLNRNILATQPRVTRFKIEWDGNPAAASAGGETEAGPLTTEAENRGENSMDHNDSNGAPTLIDTSSLNEDSFGRDRLGAENSLMEPPPADDKLTEWRIEFLVGQNIFRRVVEEGLKIEYTYTSNQQLCRRVAAPTMRNSMNLIQSKQLHFESEIIKMASGLRDPKSKPYRKLDQPLQRIVTEYN